MKKLLLIILFLPVIGFSQNFFTGVNKILDTLKIGENGASHIGVLQLYGNGSGNVRIKTASAAGSWSLTLPTAVPGSNGYVLTGNTDGTTSWAAQTGGSGLKAGAIDHYAGNTNGFTLSGDTLYLQTFDGTSEIPGLVPPSANEGKFLKDNGTWIDLGATYQTLANLSTNTSLGTSNTLYPSQNAVKVYVDNTATAQTPKAAVDYATAAALAANTYNNGTSGVGATITMNATGTVTIDGHVTALNENILIKDESTQANNGIYTVTTAGAVGVAGVFTRRTDYDQGSEVVAGSNTFVVNGTANAGKVFTQNTAGTITMGTTALNFVQTGGSSGTTWGSITGTVTNQTDLTTYISDNFLEEANNLSDIGNAGTARTNLGATTVGGNLFTLTNPSAVRFIKINADNTITARTAAEMLSDIGAQASGSYAASGANTDITSILLNQTGLVVKGGDANALTIKPNETLTTGRILNLIVNDADKTINLGGNIVTANAFTTSGNFALTLTQTGSTNVTLPTTGTLASLSGTETFTNKRITKRLGTVASSATPTINTDNVDIFTITAQAAAITSFTTNLSGTPTDGQFLWIAITDNGTARTIAWGTSFEASTVPLPTTTVISTRLDVGFVWNAATGKWRCVASQGFEWFWILITLIFGAVATKIETKVIQMRQRRMAA